MKLKINKLGIVLIIIAFFSLQSCTKVERDEEKDEPVEEPSYPPITTSGENIFAARINGKDWFMERDFLKASSIYKVYYFPDDLQYHGLPKDVLTIEAERQMRDDITKRYQFGFFIRNPKEYQTYQLNTYNTILNDDISRPTSGFFYYFELPDYPEYTNYKECYCDIIQNDQVELVLLRFDREEDIVSGTFRFDCVFSETCGGDTLKIRDGRFDLKAYGI